MSIASSLDMSGTEGRAGGEIVDKGKCWWAHERLMLYAGNLNLDAIQRAHPRDEKSAELVAQSSEYKCTGQ
jgi:hypothetical protein